MISEIKKAVQRKEKQKEWKKNEKKWQLHGQ